MKNAIRLALSALSIVVLTACGGGTSNSTVSQTSTGFTVEGGLAQKGPLLKGSRVTISELNPLNYQPSGLGYDILTKDNKGGFTSSGINFTRQHVQTFAQGYYFNEITGTLASDSVMLQAQGDLTLDRLVNVNLLTTLAGPRTVALVTDSTNAYGLSTYRNFAASRTQAQKEVLAAFRIYNVADMMNTDTSSTTVTVPNNFSELDIAKGATLNKILVTLSALVMKVGTNGVGVSQFIANFQLDLVDDGLINGSAGSSALRASIDTASLPANLDLTAVASNLNTFYALPLNLNALTGTTFTAAQLTPWVDSSGGTDLVVDKFKSSSTTAVAYTESKSATYTAGTDDAGTCFSVGSVTTGATGALYRVTTGTTTTYTAVTTPVLVTKGQSVVLGLTATAAGTYAGFIRRSAATAGVCPTTTPTTGTTRLQKYSITATAAATVPGAPTIGTATPDVAQASVAFTAPTSIGSSAITGYKASCVIGTGTAITATNPVSPVLVTGLTGGSLYSCTVQATNTAGYGAASLAVTVTPVAAVAPGAPTIGTVSAGNARASVAYTAPSSSGSSAITGYTASCALGTATPVTTTGTVNPLVVTGLTNGSLYSCTVTATNSAGTSVASSAVSVRPVDGVTAVPTEPTITLATAGAAQITVAFTAATSGTTATSYTATCGTKTATGTTSPLVVTGLTNGTAYTCTVTASNAGGVSVASTSSGSTTPAATSTTVSYSTPANFASVIATAPATTLTPALASTVTNRGYYMISNASTASATASYTTIGATYATTGYTIASGTLGTTPTYNNYLTKTMQLVAVLDGTNTYYRIDSYLHPNNSIDWGGSVSSSTLKFVNNFGKTSTTGNGYVTFAMVIDATTKVATLQAKNRYTYATTATVGTGSTSYAGTYTKDTVFAGSGRYVKLTDTAYSLNAAATSFYLYTSPLNLGVPTFMNPQLKDFVENGAAPFLTKVTTTSIEGSTGIYVQLTDTYKPQVATAGADTATKTAATAMLAKITASMKICGESLRYSTEVYSAYRDAALATKLVSDSIADGAPGQNLVPYVYFTNEQDTSGKCHPFMVVVSYGNQASPNGLKDVPHPPGSAGVTYKDATVTRYSNLENYTISIPMKDYGRVSDVTTNVYPSTGQKNLWYDMKTGGGLWTAVATADVYTWADSADSGVLFDGSVLFPAFGNGLTPAQFGGELSASGCHVGQGGGGPHCHADGYQSGKGLSLYNDTDYVGKTHPPLLGFGYDGIALFAQYRSSDSAMLGYGTLDSSFGAHDHDSIGYHYHAHTVSQYTSVDNMSDTITKDLNVLMKGAYIGVTNYIPFFRTGSGFVSNKYLGGSVK